MAEIEIGGKTRFENLLKAYLHAAICRADLSAPRNREANREANRRLCGRDWFCQKGRDIPTTVI